MVGRAGGLLLLFAQAGDGGSVSPPPTEDAKLAIAFLGAGLVAACVVSFGVIWKYRKRIGQYLRAHTFIHFGLIAVGVLLAGATILSQGVDAKRLVHGRATDDELAIYELLDVAAYVGAVVAMVAWIAGFTASEEIAALNQRIESAERAAEFAKTVNRLFLGVVGKKTDRFLSRSDELRDMPPTAPEFVKRIHEAHDPFQQCIEMLAATWSLLHLHLCGEGHTDFQLRIALFSVERDKLKVELSTDGQKSDVVKGPKRHNCDAHFRIREPRGKTLAVQAAFSQEILIEPDATVSIDNLRTQYRPHDDSHQRRIKSIVAIPLGLPTKEGEPCRRILCVDTNVAGGFKAEHLARLEQIKDNLEQRLLIEIIQTAAFQEPHLTKSQRTKANKVRRGTGPQSA